jgi:hypothetical protein
MDMVMNFSERPPEDPYAKDHLLDEIHELNVRDGDNLMVEGMEVAFGFSIWTTIEEYLNPPVVWERERGRYGKRPFSEAEIFPFPQPVGPTEVVNLEVLNEGLA